MLMSSIPKSASRPRLLRRLKYISLVGIEFEGAWESEPHYNCDVKDDGSVRMCECDFDESDEDCICARSEHIGEVCTDTPIIPTAGRLREWISRAIPDEVNETCGTHVHFSFDKNHLDYYSYIAERVEWLIEKWSYAMPSSTIAGQVRERLKNNTYCKGIDDHVIQIRDRGADRYTALNFLSLKSHGTLEARFLPGMDSTDVAFPAIWDTLEVVEEAVSRGIASRKRVVLDLSMPLPVTDSLKRVDAYFGDWALQPEETSMYTPRYEAGLRAWREMPRDNEPDEPIFPGQVLF